MKTFLGLLYLTESGETWEASCYKFFFKSHPLERETQIYAKYLPSLEGALGVTSIEREL